MHMIKKEVSPKRRWKSSREVEIDGERIAELIIRTRDPRNKPCPGHGKILYSDDAIDLNELSPILQFLNVPKKTRARIMGIAYKETLNIEILYHLFIMEKKTPKQIAEELNTDEQTVIDELKRNHFISKDHEV